MEAKITKLDPTGVIIEEAEFDIPLIDNHIDYDHYDGPKYESINPYRFFIEIGNHAYYLHKNGSIDTIR